MIIELRDVMEYFLLVFKRACNLTKLFEVLSQSLLFLAQYRVFRNCFSKYCVLCTINLDVKACQCVPMLKKGL